MSDTLYIIRKTDHGIVVASLTDNDSMEDALKALNNSYDRAKIASEEYDIPLCDVLNRRLVKVLPELTKSVASKPAHMSTTNVPVVESNPVVPQQRTESFTYTDDNNTQDSIGESFVVLDAKASLVDFDRIRAGYLEGKELTFVACPLCRGKKIKSGKLCPNCGGSGEVASSRSAT